MTTISFNFNLSIGEYLMERIHSEGKFVVINAGTNEITAIVETNQVQQAVKILQQITWNVFVNEDGDVIYYDNLKQTT